MDLFMGSLLWWRVPVCCGQAHVTYLPRKRVFLKIEAALKSLHMSENEAMQHARVRSRVTVLFASSCAYCERCSAEYIT